MAKTPIECVDCGTERMVPNACLKLVKRCKPCQVVFNRDAARNRYRKLKGIPVNAPLKTTPKKKEPVQELQEDIGDDLESHDVQRGRESRTRERTPEEEARRQEALDKLFAMLGDDSTVDDW